MYQGYFNLTFCCLGTCTIYTPQECASRTITNKENKLHSEKQREANLKIPLKFDRNPISLLEKPFTLAGRNEELFFWKSAWEYLVLDFYSVEEKQNFLGQCALGSAEL